MHTQTSVIEAFYSAFARRDAEAMNACYSEDIVFQDPVFGLIQGVQVKCMWEMLCANAKDFSLEFGPVEIVDEEYATCKWTARYSFSKTGRKVVNNVKAFMRVKDGVIIEHSDAFKLSAWAAQALGWKGYWLGWTGFMKRGIQRKARISLMEYIDRKYPAIENNA